MKLNHLTTTLAIVAIAGAAMTQSAKAQFTSGPSNTATSGDLILSFDDPSESTTDFEVDLGQFTLYTGSSQINIVNIASDLSAVYGSGWYSDSNLSFGILGYNNTGNVVGGDKNDTNFVSVSGSAFGATTGSNLTNRIATIGKISTPLLDLTNVPTDGTAANSFRVSTASGYSYDAIQKLDGYGTGSEVSFNGSTNPSVLLDTLQPGSTAFATGTSVLSSAGFSISSAGEVIYDAQVAPEPSTYALVIGGLLLLVVLKRRQAVAKL